MKPPLDPRHQALWDDVRRGEAAAAQARARMLQFPGRLDPEDRSVPSLGVTDELARAWQADPTERWRGGQRPARRGSRQPHPAGGRACPTPDTRLLEAGHRARVNLADSDFVPPRGRTPGGEEGPSVRRILLALASSLDATPWEHAGITVADQTDVPCLIVADGVLYMFYLQWHADLLGPSGGSIDNALVVAFTEDLVTWTFKRLDFRFGALDDNEDYRTGWNREPVDPSVIWDEGEGKYRMYFTLGTTSGPARGATFSATTDDLKSFAWQVEGDASYDRRAADGVDSESVLDPSVLPSDGRYELFAGGLRLDEGNHHASSTDAIHFTPMGSGRVSYTTADGDPIWMANGFGSGREARYFGFLARFGDVVSFRHSSSSPAWELLAGRRLELDASDRHEVAYVQDPAVEQRPDTGDGCYVMAYVTEIPTLPEDVPLVGPGSLPGRPPGYEWPGPAAPAGIRDWVHGPDYWGLESLSPPAMRALRSLLR